MFDDLNGLHSILETSKTTDLFNKTLKEINLSEILHSQIILFNRKYKKETFKKLKDRRKK